MTLLNVISTPVRWRSYVNTNELFIVKLFIIDGTVFVCPSGTTPIRSAITTSSRCSISAGSVGKATRRIEAGATSASIVAAATSLLVVVEGIVTGHCPPPHKCVLVSLVC